jgi:CheY-like chemotaxis protein
MKMVESQAAKKGLNLDSTIECDTPDNIVGDHGRLRQVLVNLLFNAVKFTDRGDVLLSVSLKPMQEANKHRILFAVRDTGRGIPQEKMDRLFQPFSPVETGFCRSHDGAGLGLAICKKLVELMGGEIWAESEAGKGSTFYFTIVAEVTQGLPTRSDASAQLFENLAEKHPLNILVAEDEPLNQKVLVDMLRKMGYRADAVENGLKAIEALEQKPYDLILMDVKMPRMDGIRATHEIRRRWPLVPKIIAITAYAMAGDREMCLDAGMDGYISKPVQKGELVSMLEKYGSKAP